MKKRNLICVALVIMMVSYAYAEPKKMKMTTEVPEGIVTPDRLETRLGTLNLVDGVPNEATAKKIYDNLDFQRGVQAYLNALQIASLAGMRASYLEFGPEGVPNKNWLPINRKD